MHFYDAHLFSPARDIPTYSAKVNWQNQHLQNVEDEGFNSFDRTHIQAQWKIWGQWGTYRDSGDI